MKTLSSAFALSLAKEEGTFCTMFLVTRTDGFVFSATDHDVDITFDGVTYAASSGYIVTDIESKSDMNPDNLEVTGMLESPAITEDDLLAGKWDYAAYRVFQVNWADLTQGSMKERAGRLGKVTIQRDQFISELRGLMENYRTIIGRIVAPTCDANLGDSRCKIDIIPLTVTGIIDGVGADGLTLYSSGRHEPGPVGAVAITGITNANPGVVTLASTPDPALTNLEIVMISGVQGMSPVNGVQVISNPSGSTFNLSFDTSDTGLYPAYTSGGFVTPSGSSGYFDNGRITFLSGANAGLSQDIVYYVPGQFILFLPMPYPVAIGDLYSAVPGCDRTLPTCRDRFNNILNFRGSPYIPGVDKIVQVGRRDAAGSSAPVTPTGDAGGGGGGTGTTTGGGTGGGGGSGAGGGGIGTGGGSNGGGTIDPGGGGTVASGDTLQNVSALFLNLPQVGPHGNNSSYYIAASGATDDKLSGFAVYKSLDGGATFPLYTTFGPLQVATMGLTTTALGDGGPGDALDTTNTVTVTIGVGGGTLSSDASAQSYVNYKNLILIGSELIQFRTATLISGSTYELSNLYRGCYGTEYAMTGHAIGENAVFVDAYNDAYTITPTGILFNGLIEVWDPLSPIGVLNYDQIGTSYVYKVVGAGKHLADASPITFTNTGESMRPICPYSITGARSAGDLTISWAQRFWINGGWATSLAGTIPEGWNANFQTTHTVSIFTDATYSTVKRTLTAATGTNSAVYTAAQQVSDFGSAQSTVYVQITETWIYQPASGPMPFTSHPATRAL